MISMDLKNQLKNFRSLKIFEKNDNLFFDSIIYGLRYNYIRNSYKKGKVESAETTAVSGISYREIIEKKKVKEILRENLYGDMP